MVIKLNQNFLFHYYYLSLLSNQNPFLKEATVITGWNRNIKFIILFLIFILTLVLTLFSLNYLDKNFTIIFSYTLVSFSLILLVHSFSLKSIERKVLFLANNYILKWILPPKEWKSFWKFNYSLAKQVQVKKFYLALIFALVMAFITIFFVDQNDIHGKYFTQFMLFALAMILIVIIMPILKAWRLLKTSQQSIYPIYFDDKSFYANGIFLNLRKYNWIVQLFESPMPYLEFNLELKFYISRGPKPRYKLRIPLPKEKHEYKMIYLAIHNWQS